MARSPLEQRLREVRYENASRTFTEILDAIGLARTSQRVVGLRDLEAIWLAYLD